MNKMKSFNKEGIKNSFKTKNVRYGSYSAAMIAIVIVIMVVINLIASVLPSGISSFDLTSNKIYSTGKKTQKVLDNLDKDITITVFASKDSAEPSLIRLLDNYKSSSHIKVKYLDPALNPSVTSQYSNLSSGSLLVKSGDKEQTIDSSEIYVSDYSSYYTTGSASTSFDGEGQITSAIQYVTAEVLPKMYLTTGHGEAEMSSTVSSLIAKQNIATEELNLMTAESVPADCDALMIYAPSADFSENESAAVINYLNGGGKVLLIEYYYEEPMPNFESILNAYGLKNESGIVMESANHYYQYPMYVIPSIASSEITGDLAAQGMNILMPNALALSETGAEDIAVTPLLETSSGAYLKQVIDGQIPSADQEDGDVSGQFMLAALAGKLADNDSEDAQAGELIAISSSSLIDDSITQSFSLGNLDLFTGCLSYLTSGNGVETVSIKAKSMDSDMLTVSALQGLILGAVFVIVIPLGVILAGVIIWMRRRKK